MEGLKKNNKGIKIAKPLLAALLFLAATYFVSYMLKPKRLWLVFISSPFNITVEQHPLYNMYIPAVLIFAVGFYLKNYNRQFIKKCSFRAVFIISFIASYIEAFFGLLYYGAVPLGTSVVTLSFIAVFVISLEMFAEKEEIRHIYSRFLFTIITALVLMLVFLISIAYFTNSSAVVHLIGITAFLPIFIAFYERANIMKFARHEEEIIKSEEEKLMHLA